MTKTGEAAAKISKYRPPCPIVVVSNDEVVLRQCSVSFAMLPLRVSNYWCGSCMIVVKCVTSSEQVRDRSVMYTSQPPILLPTHHAFISSPCSVQVDSLSGDPSVIAQKAADEVASKFGLVELVGTKCILALGRDGGCADADPVVTSVKLGSSMKKDKGWSSANLANISAGEWLGSSCFCCLGIWVWWL